MYLAYRPRADGSRPIGTEGQTIFHASGDRWAVVVAKRRLATDRIVVVRLGENIFSEKDERVIYPRERT